MLGFDTRSAADGRQSRAARRARGAQRCGGRAESEKSKQGKKRGGNWVEIGAGSYVPNKKKKIAF